MMKFLLTVFLALQFGEAFAATKCPVLGEFKGKGVGFLLQDAGELRPLEEFIEGCVFLGENRVAAAAKFRPLLETMFQLQQGARLITTLPRERGKIVFCDVSAPGALGILEQALNSPKNTAAWQTTLKSRFPIMQGKEIVKVRNPPEAKDAVYRDFSQDRFFVTFCFASAMDLVVTNVEQIGGGRRSHLKVSFALAKKDMVSMLFHELNHIGDECIPTMDIRAIDWHIKNFEKQVELQPKDRFTCKHMMKFFPNPKELDSLEDLFEDDSEFVCMTGFFANGEHLFWTPVCEWEVQQTSKGYFRAMHNKIDDVNLKAHLARVKGLGAGIFEGTDSAFSISFRPDCHDMFIDNLRPLTKLYQLFLACHKRY